MAEVAEEAMTAAKYDIEVVQFVEGDVVLLRGQGGKHEFTVEWHREGTVHCYEMDGYEKVYHNFDSWELVKKAA